MKDVLFDIGNIVEVCNYKDELQIYLIIGKRQYNPNSGNVWDYAGVLLDDGFKLNYKAASPFEDNNIYYFNHQDITKRIRK